jgi:GAF domain-containing protein
VNVRDLAEPTSRWPRFAHEASAAGFRSAAALPMRLRGAVIGALNLFRDRPGDLSPSDLQAAQALADVATIVVLQHRATGDAERLNAQLSMALDSRVAIEQAKGMVAEHDGVSVVEAFARLRTHARNHNLKLVEVAKRVIDHSLPIGALAPGSTRAT